MLCCSARRRSRNINKIWLSLSKCTMCDEVVLCKKTVSDIQRRSRPEHRGASVHRLCQQHEAVSPRAQCGEEARNLGQPTSPARSQAVKCNTTVANTSRAAKPVAQTASSVRPASSQPQLRSPRGPERMTMSSVDPVPRNSGLMRPALQEAI